MWVLIQTHAEVEALRHPHRAGVVLGPDARGQAVLDAVGPAQRLGLVGEPLHGDHRAEDLVLDLLVVLLQAGEHGRLVEVAAVALAPAAGLDASRGRAAGRPCRRPGSSWFSLLSGAVEDVLVVGQPGRGVLRLLGEGGDEVVVDAGPGEHAGGRRAVLAGVEVAGDRDALGGLLDVGVVEDDDRRLAAELEVDALEVVRRPTPATSMPARTEPVIETICGRLVLDQRAAGVAVAADDVEHAGRQELLADLGQQRRAGGGGVAGLEDDRCCRRPAPGRSSRSSSSAGSSTASPGRPRRSARDGSSEVWSAMYSPAERPSSTRAAPAKKRKWSEA